MGSTINSEIDGCPPAFTTKFFHGNHDSTRDFDIVSSAWVLKYRLQLGKVSLA